ncbi:MAG: Rid family detoxifying hydrolase [Actinomycetia bacterium]|nr:Rid family detoxifying hydrolase [Actinomycetes bacterium]
MADRDEVRTDEAPAPFRGAPYSQGIRVGGLVFVSGQVAIDPTTNSFAGGSLSEQAERVFANVSAILMAAGSSLDRIVKTTVYLADLDQFDAMNEVYAKHVGQPAPARTTIEASRLPAGALIEIDVIAQA